MINVVKMKNLQSVYQLSNGVKIPCVGFGTWQAQNGGVAYTAVREAIARGYRHIDTAAAYGNEESVGRAVRDSGLPREEIFVTSKLWNTDQGYESTLAAFEQTMERLGLEYLDLYLIHWPVPAARRNDWKEANIATWKAFEKLYRKGKIRAIGVSNFLQHHLENLLSCAEVAPMVNQIEVHPGCNREDITAFCQEKGILVEAWSPLARGKIMDNPVLREIAERHGKSIPQVALRWLLQRGILPLPKSVTPFRIASNGDIFDFALSGEEMERIHKIIGCGGMTHDPDHIDF